MITPMRIEVNIPRGGGAQLLDAEDFKSFKVVVGGSDEESLVKAALAPVAQWLGDDHVAIPVAQVRRLAGDRADANWEEGFGAMLGYAESKGWIVDGAIKAHIEYDLS